MGAFAFVSMIGGIFGMNMKNGFEENKVSRSAIHGMVLKWDRLAPRQHAPAYTSVKAWLVQHAVCNAWPGINTRIAHGLLALSAS